MKFSMVVVLLVGLCLDETFSKKEDEEQLVRHPDLSTESVESSSDSDLQKDATIWRHWKPGRLFKLVTRRDSSLITTRRNNPGDERSDYYDTTSTARGHSTSESGVFLIARPRGSVQRELVTMMFESMLDSIVTSWDVVVQKKPEESLPNMDLGKTPSELTFNSKRKKSYVKAPTSKTNKRSSKQEQSDVTQPDPMQQIWWSAPDERAVIKFCNGNVYEGNISMKCMHGEGRFQWADGTVYLGQFQNNQMHGKGMIQWKDDTWYEGDFVGNLRHGRGLYVDSRKQRSYAGGWHCGTKHGQGVIHYTGTFKDSYDGEWVNNVRHGFGSREYGPQSGYKGEWDQYVRDGTGLMIWPNHDVSTGEFYRGEWKNGVMYGHGIYIWDAYYNNTLALPSITAYRGQWTKGQRNGFGVLTLGLGFGSYYKGEFKYNKKHGVGKFVTNNGLILQDKKLYIDDNIGPLTGEDHESASTEKRLQLEPYKFDICDSTVGLMYHVQDAIKNIDKQLEIRANIINDYIENNKNIETNLRAGAHKEYRPEEGAIDMEDLIDFEESSLRKSLRCFETDLKNIYYQYATICNTEEVHFTPILTRLFLWQFYFDCNIHSFGLTLVDIDNMFHRNPLWLSRSPHNPFEKIYFWQFIHSLISVASKLYAKRTLPGPKPDTILASAFRTFMEKDVLSNVGRRKGTKAANSRLVDRYGQFVPLKGLYDVYRQLNEPHTVRDFLCAIRRAPNCTDQPQPPLIDASDHCLPLGHNVYIFGDEIAFVSDEILRPECESNTNEDFGNLKLFNFGNLTSKAVIKIFAKIFPQLCEQAKIMDLDIKLTFFEFFEAFIACAEESIRVKDEEMLWREKISTIGARPPDSIYGGHPYVKNKIL